MEGMCNNIPGLWAVSPNIMENEIRRIKEQANSFETTNSFE
jgi:hypothetical protein